MKVRGIVFSGFMSAILMSAIAASAADLNLASKGYVDAALSQKQNKLVAGQGIDIADNVVKSTIDVSDFVLKHEVPDLKNLATYDDLSALEKALQAEISAKHASGDYATVAQLQELQKRVEALQEGGADDAAVESLRLAVEAISADYAKKSELTATETRLQNAIDSIVIPSLDGFAKSADVAEIYATKAALADYATVDDMDAKLLTKASVSSLSDYAKKTDLQDKADVTEVTALQQMVSNIENTYVTESQVAQQITNVVGTDTTGLKKQVADNAAAIAQKADASALADLVSSQDLADLRTGLEAEIEKKQAAGDYATSEALKAVSDSLAELKGDSYTRAQIDSKIAEAVSGGQIDLSGYAKTSELEALQLLVSGNAAEITSLKNAGYQTASDVQGAITTATVDFVTESELGDYAKTSELAAVATTGSYNSLLDKPTIPSIEGLATSAELQALEDKIAAKQDAGDYLEDADLAEINSAISQLQSGKADMATVTALQTAINNLGNTYASDAELTAAIDRVVALIPAIPTNVSAFNNDAGYITSSALADYATKSEIPSTADFATKSELGDYAKTTDVNTELAKKADASALADLVTSQDLADLRTGLEAQIANKQAAGDYATAEALKAVSDSLAEYAKTSNVYTKAEVDEKIAGAATGGNVDLSGYATTSALDALQALVNGNTTEITNLKNAGYQTSTDVQNAITTATADLATQDDLAAYMATPANPGTGKYLLSATCTSKKCSYSWKLTSEIVGDGSDGTVPEI